MASAARCSPLPKPISSVRGAWRPNNSSSDNGCGEILHAVARPQFFECARLAGGHAARRASRSCGWGGCVSSFMQTRPATAYSGARSRARHASSAASQCAAESLSAPSVMYFAQAKGSVLREAHARQREGLHVDHVAVDFVPMRRERIRSRTQHLRQMREQALGTR